MRSWNAWFGLTSQAAMLGWEAQNVMALRLMRLATGGALAQSESTRMVSEKLFALGEAQAAAVFATMRGGGSPRVAKKVLGVYKKRVRGNRRRLTR
jgi:hypothetical protein